MIGHALGQSYDGIIKEVLVFDSILSNEEISKIQNYLSRKWGLESSVDSDGDGVFDTVDSNPLLDDIGSIISGPQGNSIDINENNIDIFTFSANESVNWSIESNNDGEKFSIDTSGNLIFREVPDYESPQDINKNNVYQLTILMLMLETYKIIYLTFQILLLPL